MNEIKTAKNRIWEIDFLRGIAFLCMAYNHVIFDLNFIFDIKTSFLWESDFIIGSFSAVIFMVLCGISTTFSHNSVKRGAFVFFLATLLTLATALIDGLYSTNLIIKFGILHLLGIAMILSYFIKKLPGLAIVGISTLIYLIGRLFETFTVNFDWLFIFGLHSESFYSADYYPLLPYLSFVFAGVVISKLVYKEKKSVFSFSIGRNPLSFIGRHSLLLYFVHQPVIIAIMYVTLKVTGNI